MFLFSAFLALAIYSVVKLPYFSRSDLGKAADLETSES
jgi:hypothetical protein